MKKNQKSPMRLIVILTIIVVFLVGALIVINQQFKNDQQTFDDKQLTENQSQPLIGKKDAAVKIIEFGDYKCPPCKEWSKTIFPKLKKDYIDKGKANFSYINLVNKQHGLGSELSALASEQVWKEDPDSFLAFHEALYHAQPDGDDMKTEWATPAKLAEIVEANTKIKGDKLIKSLKDKAYSKQVAADESIIVKNNVDSTPTIVINGVKMKEPFNYDQLKETIDKELKGKKADEK
ncbi:thioredoxin domain-containing protein [Bacillus sp. CLL-7-23]|uniref:Thioredoxin domain-containing protein n=1 Tax=Bacillus changyiensis TaxID=3004103 RepID=A0ABT4X570_9BACI|nr:thioredoxin domain-containing protein [Bacillus changyiensis]MDA1476402.1 thioredoxin domain-containing protein [Bacillus changyiensis]MDA7027440.1 thioredoxin domain-containing protein [Bacillus changyiensis]